jgi:hypothetical protein
LRNFGCPVGIDILVAGAFLVRNNASLPCYESLFVTVSGRS